MWDRDRLDAHLAWVKNQGGARFQAEGKDFSGIRAGRLVLTAARFIDCRFDGAVFEELCLNQAELVRCDFSRAVMRAVELREALVEDCSFVAADMRGADLVSAHVEGCDGSGVYLEGADLTASRIHRTLFLEAIMDEARLVQVDWSGLSLRASRLRGADMRQGRLEAVDLRFADVAALRLEGTQWIDCAVHGIRGQPVIHGRGLQDHQVDASRDFDGTRWLNCADLFPPST